MGLFAGAETGHAFDADAADCRARWHVRAGAPMTTVGQWLRPKTYMQPGESYDAAWRRENLAVRNACGIVDVGTLGKIDIQGPDATEFLQRVYCNNIATLAVGRIRYGLMLREDGLVMDDGTVARLTENHYLVTTTTVNAAKVQCAIRVPAAGRVAGTALPRGLGDRAVRAVRARRSALARRACRAAAADVRRIERSRCLTSACWLRRSTAFRSTSTG